MIRRVVLVALVALCGLSCNRYQGLAWGATALSFVKDSADKADLTVDEWLRYHGAKCYEQFKSKASPKYAACINPRIAVQKKWAIARDALNAAWLVARGSLQAYWAYLKDKAKGKKTSVMAVVKPIVCKMAAAAIMLKPHVPKIGEAEKVLAMVKAVTCGG